MFELKIKPLIEMQDVLVFQTFPDGIPEDMRTSVATQVNDLLRDMQADEFGVCRIAAETFVEMLAQSNSPKLPSFDVEYLRRSINHLGGLVFCFALSKSERDLYAPSEPLFGKAVDDKFPANMAEDISEAGKCLALERPTAAVFHLMRVMEIGVQKFGDTLGVALATEKNWQNILDEVNKAIRAMDHKQTRTKALAEASAHLYAVKVAWRNEVMHPKQTYTPREAATIFNNVQTFISDLAELL